MLTVATIETLLNALEKHEECIRDLDDMAYYHDNPSEPLGIYAAIATARRELEALRGQQGVWWPVGHVKNDQDELFSDEIAVSIATNGVGMAIFQWPDEGQYAVCQLVPQEGMAMPDSAGWWAKDYDGNDGTRTMGRRRDALL